MSTRTIQKAMNTPGTRVFKTTPTTSTQELGIKYDSDKPDMSLLSPLAITYLAKVLTFGAKKYSANNWRKGIDQSRLISAALRHIIAFQAGQDSDPETGLPHMAHAMCCCMFSIELMNSAIDIDTRFKYSEELKNLLAALLVDGNTK